MKTKIQKTQYFCSRFITSLTFLLNRFIYTLILITNTKERQEILIKGNKIQIPKRGLFFLLMVKHSLLFLTSLLI